MRERAGGGGAAVALVAVTALAVAAVGAVARAGAPPSSVATMLALAFVPYAGLVFLPLPRAFEARAGFLPHALALVVGLALVASPQVLSDDVHRYAWDGSVARAGIDPYAFAPADPALAGLRDATWRRVNHPEIPTIYPPVAIALFAAFGALGAGVLPFKLLALLGHLACISAVGALAGEGMRSRARLLYALQPLALVETALEGHVDAIAGLGLALATVAIARGKHGSAAAAAALAVGTKLVGLLLVPLLASRSRRAAAGLAAVALVLAFPLATAGRGSNVPGGLHEYARRWQGNGAVYALVEAGASGALELAAGRGATTVQLGAFASLPGLADVRPKKQVAEGSVAIERLAGLSARALLGAFVVAAAVLFARRGRDPLRVARMTVLVALLCSPQVHPWYLLWLLPLEVASSGLAGQVWSAAVLVAYAPLDRWVVAREWHTPSFTLFSELALVLVVLAREIKAAGADPGPLSTKSFAFRLGLLGSDRVGRSETGDGQGDPASHVDR